MTVGCCCSLPEVRREVICSDKYSETSITNLCVDYKITNRDLWTTVPSSGDHDFTTVRPIIFEPPEKLTGTMARLVGLFNTCVEVLDDFDVCADLGNDSHYLATQFEAEKRRFQKWVTTVGFPRGRLIDNHDSALKDPHTYSTIEKLLLIIKGIFSNADDIFQDPKLGTIALPSKSQAGPHQSPLPESKRSQFREKARRMAKVELLEKLVRRLHFSISPGGSKGSRLERSGPGASSDAGEHVDST
jgi:hypothetical protein